MEEEKKQKTKGGKDEEEAKKQKTKEGKEEEKKEVKPQSMDLDQMNFQNETGIYELFAVLTHKGRNADSGHYVAWIKETEDKWIKYDDDVISYCNSEEIKKLSGKGGGDWHMAYMIVYRTKKI